MDFNNQQFVLTAYAISNITGLLFLLIANKWPRITRILFALLFAWASWVNYTGSHQHPEVYMNYSERALPIYRNFINGWFKEHITIMVSSIAIGQLLIAIGMVLKGNWVTLACIGAIIFLLAIAPLGLYSAFPFSLTVSAAAYLILRKDDKNYIWMNTHKKNKTR
jgi:hypothetical protein